MHELLLLAGVTCLMLAGCSGDDETEPTTTVSPTSTDDTSTDSTSTDDTSTDDTSTDDTSTDDTAACVDSDVAPDCYDQGPGQCADSTQPADCEGGEWTCSPGWALGDYGDGCCWEPDC